MEKLTYSVEEVAKILGIGRSKAYELVCQRENFPTVRFGKRIVIPRVALETWLAEEAKKNERG